MGKRGPVRKNSSSQLYHAGIADYWKLIYSDQAIHDARAIIKFYQKVFPEPVSRWVVDVGCGTGEAAREFLSLGYSLVAIDFSSHMLKHVRKLCARWLRRGELQIVQGDARDYKISNNAGLVMSVGAVINHLRSEKDIEAYFTSAHRALIKNGYFILQLLTRETLMQDNVYFFDNSRFFTVERSTYDPHSDSAYHKISGFLRTESRAYRRFSQVMTLKAFDVNHILQLSKKAGFKNAYTAWSPELSRSADENAKRNGRFFIIAQK